MASAVAIKIVGEMFSLFGFNVGFRLLWWRNVA